MNSDHQTTNSPQHPLGVEKGSHNFHGSESSNAMTYSNTWGEIKMAKQILVRVSGTYRDAETSVRAKLGLTKQERKYLFINTRQIKRAADHCCYAGTDFPVFEELDGFGPWEPTQDGIVCYIDQEPEISTALNLATRLLINLSTKQGA